MAEPVDVLTIDVRPGDRVLTVRLAGEIDAATAPQLTGAVLAHLDGVATTVTLDLHDVSFCDSSGLRSFVGLHRRITDGGGELILDGVGPRVMTVIDATALDQLITVKTAHPDGLQPGR